MSLVVIRRHVFVPAYCQVSVVIAAAWPDRSRENRPSRSSVSSKSSRMMAASVGVLPDVFVEPRVALQHVVHQRPEEHEVAPGPQRHVYVGHRRGAREARIDVDDRRAALLRLHHEAEPDRVVLGHVRAHDDDAVAVCQSPEVVVAPPRPSRAPRPGTVLAVSYAGLVLDADDAQAGREQLLDQVVLFVVERRAAEVADAERAVDGDAVLIGSS